MSDKVDRLAHLPEIARHLPAELLGRLTEPITLEQAMDWVAMWNRQLDRLLGWVGEPGRCERCGRKVWTVVHRKTGRRVQILRTGNPHRAFNYDGCDPQAGKMELWIEEREARKKSGGGHA